jgi:hypothetical protein
MTTSDKSTGRRILTAFAVLIFSTLVFAHGNEQHVIGTVAKIEPGSITVKTIEGDAKTVMIVADTKFVKGSSPATQQDVKVGDRVVVHARPEGGMLYATEVKIGQKPDSAQH